MKITQVRNATVIVEYMSKKFLIDPWLMPKNYMPGFETAVNSEVRQPRVELPFDIEKIIDVDAVIVTHIHPDHWDEFAEKSLKKDIKIFVQSQIDQVYLNKKGFTNVEVLNKNGTSYENIMLYKTDTQHGKREIVKPLCISIGMPYDAMGIIFKSGSEKTLYVAGDTIWCQEIKDALDKYNPDIIIVNACAATVLNGERLIMNIDDLREVMKNAPGSTIIASHMDTVSHQTITRNDLKEFVKKESIKNFLIPNDGEVLNF